MGGEKYAWIIIVMLIIAAGFVFGVFFLHDQEVRALNANSPGNASQYNMLKFVVLGAGIALEILILVRILMMKLAERPKTKRFKIKVAEPGEKKPERLKLRVAEPSKKEEKPKLKIRVAELSLAEKERRIKEIIETLWKKKGEASMDEIVSEAAKQGIDERDVEKFLESEKKRGKLALET